MGRKKEEGRSRTPVPLLGFSRCCCLVYEVCRNNLSDLHVTICRMFDRSFQTCQIRTRGTRPLRPSSLLCVANHIFDSCTLHITSHGANGPLWQVLEAILRFRFIQPHGGPDMEAHKPQEQLSCTEGPKAFLQGLETLADVSEAQLEACAGGPVLRAEGVYVTLNNKGIQKGAQVLLQALQQVDLLIMSSKRL